MTTTTNDRGRGLLPAVFAVIALIGLVSVVWVWMNQQADPPAPASAATAEVSSEPAPTSAPADASPTEDVSESETDEPVTAVNTPAPPAYSLAASEPVSISIPSIDVTSDLHALGLADDGSLEVPSGDLYDQAAWYDGSPTPGEVGPSVIEGHVTSAGSTPSVFFELGAVEVGDVVDVDREDGSTASFEVYDISSFPKDEFPTLAVYGNTTGSELRVITCGGTYSADDRAHEDNIVVFAKLVES